VSTGPETKEFAHRLAAAIAGTGKTACVMDSADGLSGAERFHAVEADHDIVIYAGSTWEAPWTSLCMRQADRLLLVAAGPADASVAPLPGATASLPWRTADLVLLAGDGDGGDLHAAAWLDRFCDVRCHHHMRWRSPADLARLARALTGRAVGLVLSGGGARGFGHVGVIKALRAGGIPVDVVGGTSIGSIIAAGVALEWDDGELDRRLRAAFVESDPLDDYTIPFVALVRGEKVTARLRQHFGEVCIEDLPRPLFCVASNLTSGAPAVLQRGPLWRALRASIAIPGLLPPATHEGQLLVDGAVLNNLPADILGEHRLGPILGVDVTRYRTIGPGRSVRTRSVARFLRRWLFAGYEGPGIATLLMSAANMGSDAQTRQSRASLDALLEPPLESIHIRDWQAYDRAVEAGYRHAMEHMEELQGALLPPSAKRTG
jgi:NTE family protein